MSDAKEAVKRLGEISYLIERQAEEIVALRKDAERLNHLEQEYEVEQRRIAKHEIKEYRLPLFRRNMPITRDAIDAEIKKKP